MSAAANRVDTAGVLNRLLAELTDVAHAAGPRDAAERLAAAVRDAGADSVDVVEVEAGHFNVVGRTPGPSDPRLLVTDLDALRMSAVDTADDEPASVTVSDGFVRGRGAEAIGATAASLLALSARADAGSGLRFLAATGSHEGGTGARHFLDGCGSDLPAQAVVCSPTGLAVHNAEAGITQLVITLKGRAVWVGQSSLLPWVNAIDKVLTAVARLHDSTFDGPGHADYPGLPSLTVTAIRGGLTEEFNTWRPAIVADHAAVLCDLSHPPGVPADEVVAQVRTRLDDLAAHDEEFDYELATPPLTRRDPWHGLALAAPPLDPSTAADAAAAIADVHEAVVGEAPRVVARPGRGGGLAGHLGAEGVSCVGYGPGDPERPGSVEVSEIQRAGDVLAGWSRGGTP